ncbi:MAG TPA: tripartite tricarboxylate transporter TctB family protein [Dongiaceae bacterium]|nr:tripartite tricarboxylate transporter TctB family protein [Dongiaceae bacterium]
MRIRSQKDFASGAMFLCIGAGFAIVARNYPMGTAERMGPGYFPFWLGILLALLGAIIVGKSLNFTDDAATVEEDRLDGWNLKGLFLILGSVVLLGFLIHYVGLVGSILVSVIVSSIADRNFTLRGTLINAVLLAVICVLGFVYGLGLQMPVWPPFFGL